LASEIIRTNVRDILGTKVKQLNAEDLLLPYQKRGNPNFLTEKHAWYVSGCFCLVTWSFIKDIQ
jgi:hypothetical protein